eukprot:scaffold111120_cov64-Phaeocystis_antarctica.AAC.3
MAAAGSAMAATATGTAAAGWSQARASSQPGDRLGEPHPWGWRRRAIHKWVRGWGEVPTRRRIPKAGRTGLYRWRRGASCGARLVRTLSCSGKERRSVRIGNRPARRRATRTSRCRRSEGPSHPSCHRECTPDR